MTTETVLTVAEISKTLVDAGILSTTQNVTAYDIVIARAIEQAVLQSEQVQAWKRDAERLDWLADPKNSIGDVQLPTVCVKRNPHSLRDAIDAAMEQQI